MNRVELSKQKYQELFNEVSTDNPTDPEFMNILKNLIFGEIFYVGDLSDTNRELITVTVLAVQQTLPQLKAHTKVALHIGVTPVAIKEAIYQLAPFIGFPKTLNAIATINEVFVENNIHLPLPNQGTIKEEQRFTSGKQIQYPIYGDEIKERFQTLPSPFKEAIPTFLTAFGFGDFHTRTGLDIQTRELLILCCLTTLGLEKQIFAHVLGNLKVGNTKETLLAALLHCAPYIGFPNSINAINFIKELKD